MTLEKIIAIKNVGRFLNSTASGDVSFNLCNLIFAENGRGKTTLCAILRSLQSGEPAYIQGRKTLGYQGMPEVRFRLAGGNVNFTNGTWDNTVPELAVFDSTFVSENVYSGEAVDTEQRRNLYRAIIGSQGVALARQIEELSAQITAKNMEIRGARAEVQGNVPRCVTFDAFIDLAEDPDIDTKIDDKEQELAAVRQADRIRGRHSLEEIAMPDIPDGFDAILAKTLEGVAEDAQRQIAGHIAAQEMREDGETWLSEGVLYIHDESCPFCGQDLKGIDLIAVYKAYFSDAYNALRDEISAMVETIEQVFGDGAIAAIERKVEQNTTGVEFWKEYCKFEAPQLDETLDIGALMREVRTAALVLLTRKLGAPLEAIIADHGFRQPAGFFETLHASVAVHNTAVEAANVVIIKKKQQTSEADLEGVGAEFERLIAQKTRYQDEPKEVCETYQTKQGEKIGLEDQKTLAREQLDSHTDKVIEQYGQSINRYLDRINAGFCITTPDHTYRGGTPSSSYQIVINETPVNLGNAETPLSQASFKNTLSSGDRSTLALALFLAELEQDPNRANKIVVFDDPFTSQDSFRRNHTAFQIKLCGQNCAQTVVLSHDPWFLKDVWDKLTPNQRKTLQLARVGENNTIISEWDIEKALQAQYRADIKKLHAYYAGGEGIPRDVVQKVRPVLEGYCRNVCPQFGDDDMLGGMVRQIRETGLRHSLTDIVDELDEINDYSRRYHHGENPNAATDPIDGNELNNYVKRTLKIVGSLT